LFFEFELGMIVMVAIESLCAARITATQATKTIGFTYALQFSASWGKSLSIPAARLVQSDKMATKLVAKLFYSGPSSLEVHRCHAIASSVTFTTVATVSPSSTFNQCDYGIEIQYRHHCQTVQDTSM
jgi:hypothetical protein